MKTSIAGQRLRQLREARGLSRERLARMLGTTGGSIFRYENGTRKLTVELIQRFADALQVGAAEMMPGAPVTSLPVVGSTRENVVQLVLEEPDSLAVIIDDETMAPVYRPGEVVGCAPRLTGDAIESLVGFDCAVAISADQILVRRVEPGGEAGRYTLRGYAEDDPALTDVVLRWAAPVRWHRRQFDPRNGG